MSGGEGHAKRLAPGAGRDGNGTMGAVAAWPRDLLASAGAAVFAALSHRLMNGFFLS